MAFNIIDFEGQLIHEEVPEVVDKFLTRLSNIVCLQIIAQHLSHLLSFLTSRVMSFSV